MDNELFRGEYMNWLPIDNEDELIEATKWLEKWALHFAYMFGSSKDEDDKRLFEYKIQDKHLILKPPFTNERKRTQTLAIIFKLYKSYL